MASSRGIVALVAVAACASGDDDTSPPRQNVPPEASLRVPVIAPAGVPVSIDAGASVDPDGDPLTYVFSFTPTGETISSTEPVIQHAFTNHGIHSVVVRVFDPRGAESTAAQDISVRDEYPEPPDFCASAGDCVVGDECDGGVCYQNGGMVE
jgi:hypothetical protein